MAKNRRTDLRPTMAAQPHGRTLAAKARTTTSDRIYASIRNAILAWTLAPNARLVELSLATELGVSRTPIREALQKLAAEGLVETDSVKGLIVRSIDAHEVDDFYTVREVLDGLTARLAAERISADSLLRLRLLLEAMEKASAEADRDGILEASNRFHDVITRAASNRWLTTIGRAITDFVAMISSAATVSYERDQAVIAEHRRILDAIVARDPQAAEDAARRHVMCARDHFVRITTTVGLS